MAAATTRTRWMSLTAMSTFPALSMATAWGLPRLAEVAGPPSPLIPSPPSPAIV